MKKKWLTIIILFLFFLATGCQTIGNQSADNYGREDVHSGKGLRALYKQQGAKQADENNPRRSIFPNAFDRQTGRNGNHEELGRSPEPGTRMAQSTIPYGYVERTAHDPLVIQSGYGANIHIDREVLADAVAQIVVGLNNVNESAVIVTDQNCIIGYEATEKGDHIQQQVELAGQSVTPRWFHVYATDDMELVKSIKDVTRNPSGERLGKQLRKQVDFIINQLGGPKESWEHPMIQNDPGNQNQQRNISDQQGIITNQQQSNNHDSPDHSHSQGKTDDKLPGRQ